MTPEIYINNIFNTLSRSANIIVVTNSHTCSMPNNENQTITEHAHDYT